MQEKMTHKEKVKKDIEMTFDFVRYLIDHPEELAKIPNGSEIYFHDKTSDIPVGNKVKRKGVRVDVKRNFEIKKKVA
jgi:hypothetical protein